MFKHYKIKNVWLNLENSRFVQSGSLLGGLYCETTAGTVEFALQVDSHCVFITALMAQQRKAIVKQLGFYMLDEGKEKAQTSIVQTAVKTTLAGATKLLNVM